MTMIALLMVPWINIMIEKGVEPRVLADDLMFTISGPDNRSKTIEAMKISRQYFEDIGAKVADKKCFTFATDTFTREYITNYDFDGNGLYIPNHHSFRDLGAHLNFTQSTNGSTLTERMYKACEMAKRLKYMPISRQQKEKMSSATYSRRHSTELKLVLSINKPSRVYALP